MGLQLAAPWMLLGLGLLALPVIAHLTGYQEVRTVSFPSLRFLVESQLLPCMAEVLCSGTTGQVIGISWQP